MKIIDVSPEMGKAIERFGSRNAMITSVGRTNGETDIHYLYLGADGVLGYHQAVGNQLFLVVAGEGWVRGETTERVRITAGHAAFWEKGEWHESGTESGMTVVVIEGDEIRA